MKKQKILIKILLVIIIALIALVVLMFNQNNKLNKMSEIKEQLSTEDGFISTSEHLTQIAAQDVGKKVIELGSGTSFDLSSYEGYENFTNDNFIVNYNASVSTGLSTGCTNGYCYWYHAGFTFTGPTISYNAATGILTITNQNLSSVIGIRETGGPNYNMTGSTTVSNVYLIY